MRKNQIKKGFVISIIFLFLISGYTTSINSISNADSFRKNKLSGDVTWVWIDDDGAVWGDANSDEIIPYIPNAENVPLDIQFKILDSDGNPFGNLTEGQGSGLCKTFIECAENITISGNSLFTGKLSDFPGFTENFYWYNDSIWIVPIIPTMNVGGGSITFDVIAYNESISKTINIGGLNYYHNGSVVNVEPNEFKTGFRDQTLLISAKFADDGSDMKFAYIYLYYLDDTPNGSIDNDIHGPITAHCVANTFIYSNGYYTIPFNITQQIKNQTTGLHGQGGAGFPSIEYRRNLTVYVDGPGNRDGYALIEMVPPLIIYVDDDNTQGPWNGTYEHPYQFIQDGINKSDNGDMVFVFNGTYYENISISKNNISILGEDKYSTIIDAGDIGDVVSVYGNYLYIGGFTIQNSGNNTDDSGIKVESDYNYFSNNIIYENFYGFCLNSSKFNTIIDNKISNNSGGIMIESFSYKNTIIDNTISLNYNGIILEDSSKNMILDNTITYNDCYAIFLHESNNNLIDHNNVSNNLYGITLLKRCNNNTISNNIASNCVNGIALYYYCNNNTIIGNIACSNNYYGIMLSKYNINNTVEDNNVLKNKYGIILGPSDNYNIIKNNNANSNEYHGIHIIASNNNNIINNNVSNNEYGLHLSCCNDNIVNDNNAFDNEYGIGVEYSENITIKDNDITSNNLSGIFLMYSSFYNLIENNNVSNSEYGIGLESSNYNIIKANNVNSNNFYGIILGSSSNNTILENNATNNRYGIMLHQFTSNNTIINNNLILNSYHGIELYTSINNTVSGNNVSNNYNGITIYSSSNNNLVIKNIANSNNNYGIRLFEFSNNNKITENIVKSNNGNGISLDTSSSKNTISNNNINSNNNHGIILDYLNDNNTINNNNISDNKENGIHIESSSNNTIKNNFVFNNSNNGIILRYNSINNIIYNNYFNNSINAFDECINQWNITKTAGINIIGGPYFGGNYWSDYTGIDINGDGLGDTNLPYNSSGKIQNKGDLSPLTEINFFRPDLDCSGNLDWTGVNPGETVYGTITVDNVGDTESLLNWEIQSYPTDWGTWSFNPESGTDLLSGDSIDIDVEVVAPDEEETTFTGEIVIVNINDLNDKCIIEVSLATPIIQTQGCQQILRLLLSIIENNTIITKLIELY